MEFLNEQYAASVDNRYTLVVVAAKRARQILSGAKPRVTTDRFKPVTVALDEVKAGKVKWVRTKEGIK